ncbi:hypothetical protein X975_06377, partial [Stegodyphus mimosarum]
MNYKSSFVQNSCQRDFHLFILQHLLHRARGSGLPSYISPSKDASHLPVLLSSISISSLLKAGTG